MRESMTIEDSKPCGTTTLASSGNPIDFNFRLLPIPEGAPVPYSEGETLPLDLHMSRGWVKKVNVKITGTRTPLRARVVPAPLRP
jgi:hypothetical protein